MTVKANKKKNLCLVFYYEMLETYILNAIIVGVPTKRAPLQQQESLDAPPPPMSLSAPDLSSLSKQASDFTPIQFQRNAVSSTELLHEKAMARLYQVHKYIGKRARLKIMLVLQALAAEEARNEKKRQETIEAEDAMEMSQAPEQDLPRAKITDTGQEKLDEVIFELIRYMKNLSIKNDLFGHK